MDIFHFFLFSHVAVGAESADAAEVCLIRFDDEDKHSVNGKHQHRSTVTFLPS